MRMASAGSLSPQDIGRRVTIRSREPDGAARDVIGELLSLDEEQLRVRDARGDEVAIPTASVVAARVVGRSRR